MAVYSPESYGYFQWQYALLLENKRDKLCVQTFCLLCMLVIFLFLINSFLRSLHAVSIMWIDEEWTVFFTLMSMG